VGLVVTGISQTTDSSALEAALKAAGLSLEPLSVYVSGDAPDERPDSGIRFVYTGNDSIREILGRGSGGIYASGSGSVPGLELDEPSEYFRRETVADELSELEIPDSMLENYEDAIEAGHAVAAYFARPETVATAEGAFRSAGLANVQTF
jgi:hypothetical protein